jgi:hypothetical protein
LLFEFVDLVVQEFEDGLDTALGDFGRGLLEAIGFGGTEVEELSSAFDELLKFGLRTGGFFEAAGLDGLSEACEDGGVEGVGFGEDSDAFGEIADLPGVGEGDMISAVEQFGDDEPFVSSGAFESDEAGFWGREFGEELEDA